jgi:arylsulfatase A-like enzyme
MPFFPHCTTPARQLGALALTGLMAGAWLAGCADAPSGARRPLLDGDHAPDVLTERRELAFPPSLSGNRFLTGWFPWRDDARQLSLVPLQASRIEIVNLASEPRTLVLDLHDPPQPGKRVRVRAAGREIGTFALADPLEIPLPADLPVGRVAIDFDFDSGTPGVLAAGLRPVLPAGGVRVQGENLGQRGDSLVELVYRLSGDETLVGTFIPPSSPGPDQSFELSLERADGSRIRKFTWSPSFWNRIRGRRDFSLYLRRAEGFVRLRLRARGNGPAGEWRGLALIGGPEKAVRRVSPSGMAEAAPAPAPDSAPDPLSPSDPPRLVIVYVMDALRADTVGALGGPAGVSPNYDRLAREGLLFKRHRSVAPNTIPSTKSFFTGRTFLSRGGWSLLPEDGETLAELFRKAGYHTGLFSGNVYVSHAYGTDRGFEHVATDVLIDGYTGKERPPFNDNAARAHAAASAWLRSLPPGAKAFLYFHTIHPHNPYDPPEPFRSRFTQGIPSAVDGSTETLTDIKQARRPVPVADQQRLRGLYTASFSYNDAELGDFLADVAGWARPAETLVALTSDHGEELFDHGGVLHGFTLYEEMVRIPLVLWAPGRLRPGAVEAPTDSLDLHATLIEMAGLQPAAPSGGRSLLAIARGEGGDYLHLAAASSLKGGMYSAQSDRWKVIWAPRTGTGWGLGSALGRSCDAEYLFDLRQDPGEKSNRAGLGDIEAAWLRSRLLAWIEKNRQSEEAEGGAEPVDPETLDRLRALGYVN